MHLRALKTIPGEFQTSHWQIRPWAADAVEAVFGPDPGLLRLRLAGRTVISAAATLTTLLLLFGTGGMKAAAPIALGFMVSNFANMSVRDARPLQQAITLALLAVPALGCVTLASVLSAQPWPADLVFVAVVTGAALARMAGPRGTAIGMVAFISYFIGEITRPPLTSLPELTVAVFVAIGAAAVARFALLPDRPGAALNQVRLHIKRRISRILLQVENVLAPDGIEPTPTQDETRRHRMHRELARLNDAILIAENQIRSLELAADQPSIWRSFFAVELAAERLIRMAPDQRHARDLARARARIRRLRTHLATDTAPVPFPGWRSTGKLSAAVDQLQTSLARMGEAWTKLPAAQSAGDAAPTATEGDP